MTRTPSPPIDMSHTYVHGWVVIDYLPGHGNRAHWLCRHLCGAERILDGTTLRAAERKPEFFACRRCGE